MSFFPFESVLFSCFDCPADDKCYSGNSLLLKTIRSFVHQVIASFPLLKTESQCCHVAFLSRCDWLLPLRQSNLYHMVLEWCPDPPPTVKHVYRLAVCLVYVLLKQYMLLPNGVERKWMHCKMMN